MDIFSDQATLSLWLTQYGSIVLFVLLALGIVALPVPEETLMVLAGVLMRQGTLSLPETLLASFGGSICGITTSYFLGSTAGHYLVHNYGSMIGLTESRLEQVHQWFERFGKWTLFIGYFIPGVRHFTGFSAGMTELSYGQFALFAYLGALFWVSTFLSIGYYFGNYCFESLAKLEFGLNEGIILLAILVSGYLLFKYKSRFKF